MIIKNPDKRQIYHCWHYCNRCLNTWTHSQGDWEHIKNHVNNEHNGNWNPIITVPTDNLEVEL